jgi:hypothetical protein
VLIGALTFGVYTLIQLAPTTVIDKSQSLYTSRVDTWTSPWNLFDICRIIRTRARKKTSRRRSREVTETRIYPVMLFALTGVGQLLLPMRKVTISKIFSLETRQ